MRPYGVAINGKFFPDAESLSPVEWAKLMLETFPDDGDIPSIIWYDAACEVTPTLLAGNSQSSKADHFSNTMILTVPLNQPSHVKSDWFCQNFCNASAPDKKTWLKSAAYDFKVNGTICEKNFVWFGRYHKCVKSMQKDFAELFYLVLLDEHNAELLGARACTHPAVHDKDGNQKKGRVDKNMSTKATKFRKTK